MNNLKKIKTALFSSVFALLVCSVAFVSSTFAWFTDSELVNVETITVGNLDLAITDANGEALDNELNWVSAGTNAVLWEPGASYNTEEFYIENKGNLNLKFMVNFEATSQDVELLDVIDFSATADATQLSFGSENAIITATGEFDLFKGLVVDTLFGTPRYQTFTEYVLEPGQKVGPLAINATMDEDAGNEYKGMTLDGISLTIVATQAVGEQDSFDGTYDYEAVYPTVVKNENELKTALNEGAYIELKSDIELTEELLVISNESVIDLDGNTISNPNARAIKVDGTADVTLKNGNVEATNGEIMGIFGEAQLHAKNVNFTGKYCFGMNGTTTLETSYAEFENCNLLITSGYNAAYISAKGTYVFKNCTLEGGAGVLVRSGNVVLDGCEIIANGYYGKGQTQNAFYANYDVVEETDTLKDGIAYWDKSGDEKSTGDCVVIVDRSGKGYELKSVTIKNCKFRIVNSITSESYTGPAGYAVRYIDRNANDCTPIVPVYENNVDAEDNAIVAGNAGGYVYSSYTVVK